ncbi:MAG: hypothetical protein JWP65_1399 [Ramlibacter sp.]|jgi:hypothetical protein|uniref:hypothetical protein n=1 Tax=Ramlibacter sp. TaxID=1917967 RepID=UPI0026393E25|nr:hypothetical protein [Ramlibacter sp.]MDB5750978.1 hypothetical protein [Ramlibacter sp.]
MPNPATHLPPDGDPKQAQRKPPVQVDAGAPHAGRVGDAGARAERPSEGGKKLSGVRKPGRGAKSPSAAKGTSR